MCYLYFQQRNHICDIYIEEYFETIQHAGEINIWKCSLTGDINHSFLNENCHEGDIYECNKVQLQIDQQNEQQKPHEHKNVDVGENKVVIIDSKTKYSYSISEFFEEPTFIIGITNGYKKQKKEKSKMYV